MKKTTGRDNSARQGKRRQPPSSLLSLAGLFLALLLYAYFAFQQRFIQDDAYISYRYVANFLDGHGLVWNIGEQIEGFTNFGWVIILAFIGRIGGDFIFFSRVIGFLCGAGIIVTTWLIARRVTEGASVRAILLAVLLVGANGALAYWSAAGLETAAFGLMASLSLYFYLTRNRMLIWTLLMAVWMRPDGVVIALALLLAEAVSERRLPLFVFSCGAAAAVLSMPMLVFKLFYYGSIFPNSFYAKTAADSTQMLNGLTYTWEYLRDYGFFGIGIAILLIRYRALSQTQRAVVLFCILFLVYVVVIGGDVLKVYRFFIPIFGIAAVVTVLAVAQICTFLKSKIQPIAWTLFLIFLPVLTWFVPGATIRALGNERDLVTKMKSTGEALLRMDSTEFSIATTTVGALGYTLQGHRVIDMLGLTDSTIARHPETIQETIASTWKERSFNTPYLLSQAPDYVLFSTGIKPSAPAEKSLFRYRDWDRCYRVIPCDMPFDVASGDYLPNYLFRRVRPTQPPFEPVFSPDMVDKLTSALQTNNINNPVLGYQLFEEARQMMHGEESFFIRYFQAMLIGDLISRDSSLVLMAAMLKSDSLIPGAQRDLYVFARADGERDKAAIHRAYLQRLSPVDLQAADAHLARLKIP